MSAVAVGVFDGVHLGHAAILGRARERAAGGPLVVVSFDPHPDVVLRKTFEAPAPLTPYAEKRERLLAHGVDRFEVLPFTRELAALEPEAFVDRHLVEPFHPRWLVVGENFALGRARAGTPPRLAEIGRTRGFEVEAVPLLEMDGGPVTSTRIRGLIGEGHVAEAGRLLGRRYALRGTVVRGEAIGRTLGYPTANLRLGADCGLKHGIYAVRVGVGGTLYDGVASFGRRPMFDTGAVLLEIFLFDFSGDLYGAALDCAFIAWIRPEMNFPNVEELIRRMDQDSSQARHALAREPDAFPPLGVPG